MTGEVGKYVFLEVWYVPNHVGYLQNESNVVEKIYIPNWNVTQSQEWPFFYWVFENLR